MALFENSNSDILSERLDWQILQHGWVSLYWRKEILNRDVEWFKKEKFEIALFDCSEWNEERKMHEDLRNQLLFPGYYGNNLNALNDVLSDLIVNDAGTLLVFQHFQIVAHDLALGLLDILATNARRHLLFGKKLITLIQVDDPNYQINAIGACSVLWNNAEWLNKDRNL